MLVPVKNITTDRTHRYNDRARHIPYVWSPGTTHEVPEDVAAEVCGAWPQRLQVVELEVEEVVAEAEAVAGAEGELDSDPEPDPEHTRHYFKADGVCKCGEVGEANTRPLAE